MPMKKQINPVVAGVLIFVVLAAITAWMYKGASQSSGDTQLPPEIAKKLKEQGPRPMPAIPMPGGGTSAAPGGTQNKAPGM